MSEIEKNYNALLLEVMAHDLMAPLTAIKWQIELLGKSYKDTLKREKYLKGLAESTELGIALGKYAHSIGRVLGGTYEGFNTKSPVSKVIKSSVENLRLQYERHALTLRLEDVEQGDAEKEFDVQLVELYVWCIAKYFLAVTAPNSEVVVRGKMFEKEGKKYYSFSVSSDKVDRPQLCLETFQTQQDHELAQISIFSKLIHMTSGILQVTPEARVTDDSVFSITTTFEVL